MIRFVLKLIGTHRGTRHRPLCYPGSSIMEIEEQKLGAAPECLYCVQNEGTFDSCCTF